MIRIASFVLLLLINVSCCCCYKPSGAAYKEFYAHIENPPRYHVAEKYSDNFLILFVNARHLDYTDNCSFLRTICRHPSDGSTNRDVGHVWIYLQGVTEGKSVCVYGGHSGERGFYQAKYFDGIMNYIDYGYANPTKEQISSPSYEANPAKCLWETQKDGYFEWGAGIHRPTYAVKLDLTKEQFARIFDFVVTYDYSNYSLVGNQCASFAAQVACLAGLELECKISMRLKREIYLKGERIRFWEDPTYSLLTISSPDIIERSMMKAVERGEAEYFGR